MGLQDGLGGPDWILLWRGIWRWGVYLQVQWWSRGMNLWIWWQSRGMYVQGRWVRDFVFTSVIIVVVGLIVLFFQVEGRGGKVLSKG